MSSRSSVTSGPGSAPAGANRRVSARTPSGWNSSSPVVPTRVQTGSNRGAEEAAIRPGPVVAFQQPEPVGDAHVWRERAGRRQRPAASRSWWTADMKNGQSDGMPGLTPFRAVPPMVAWWPVRMRLVLWLASSLRTLRTTANRSARRANSGRCSHTRKPGHGRRDRLVRPADLGRGVRLHVERVELAPPAEQEQADDRLGLGAGPPATAGRPRPQGPEAPARRSSRRVRPAHDRFG